MVPFFARLFGYLAAFFLTATMMVTVADVFLRTFFSYPMRGVLELVELGLACTIFLALPAVFLRDEHLVVDVIDHLLATPEPQGPLAVQLIEVKGEIPSTRPWVRYEFSDPAHQARSAGQKILLRIGVDNQRRLTAKLAEIRRLVTVPAGRPPGGG